VKKLQDELKQLAVDDFMTTGEDNLQLLLLKTRNNPSTCLNCTLIANATTVLYDNLTLKDVSGKLIVKDEK
jgi:hypothetical protein